MKMSTGKNDNGKWRDITGDCKIVRSNDLLDGWEILPSDDSRYESLFIPIEKDPDGEEAKSKAIDLIEYLWDCADSLETVHITVTLKRVKIHKNDYDAEGSDI